MLIHASIEHFPRKQSKSKEEDATREAQIENETKEESK